MNYLIIKKLEEYKTMILSISFAYGQKENFLENIRCDPN